MSSRWTCRQVHETDTSAALTTCPVCGESELNGILTIEVPPQFQPTISVSAEFNTPPNGRPSSQNLKVEVPGYEIISELGRGGMGVVYKAKQNKLNRLVALKMILAAEHAGPTEKARFEIEAEAVAQLQHPNIVQIYEVGEASGRPYFSLEFVDGGTLASRLTGTPEPPRAAAALVENLARAVAAAHAIGIVHRDLKPANVLLAKSLGGSDMHKSLSSVVLRAQHNYGMPKIADFGLAKKIGGGGSGNTQSGAIIGTPSYMSPEQASGNVKSIGPHTDVYALGAILYELLTGRPPFNGETPIDTIMQVIRDEPAPPRSLQPKLPRDLEIICLKCLEKKSDKRYANAVELAADLQRYLDGEAISARAATHWERTRRWVRRHPMATGLLAVGIVALTTLVAVFWVYHQKLQASFESSEKKNEDLAAEQQRTKAEQERSNEQNIHLMVGNGTECVNNGDYLRALVWFTEALRRENGNVQKEEMHRVRIANLVRQSPRLTRAWFHEGRVNDAVFSPDGKHVLTACADGKARIFEIADLAGRQSVLELEHPAAVIEAKYAQTGEHIVTSCADTAVRIWDAKTGKPVGEPYRHAGAITHVEFSPDGQRALSTSADRTARIWEFGNPDEPSVFLKQSAAINYAEFDWSGERIVTAGADGAARVWDAKTGKPVSPVLTHQGPIVCACFSPDGKQVVTASQDQTARVWEVATGRPVTPLIRRSTPLTDAAFSPNGRDIVTASTDGTGRVWNLDLNDWRTFVVKHDSAVLDIIFSPDGRAMATGGSDNTARVWAVSHLEPLTPPMRHNGSVYHVVFDKDGAQLLTASQDGLVRLWDIAAARGRPNVELKSGPAAALTYSPDRRHYLRIEGDAAKLCDAATGQLIGLPLQHRGLVRAAVFSPDGTRIITGSADRTARIWDTDTGQPVGEAMLHGSEVSCVAFGPDGKLAATGSEDNTARLWVAETGQPVTTPLRHFSTVRRVVMSPDGRCLLTESQDGLARVWDAITGEPLTPAQRPSGWVAHVLNGNEALHGWDLPPDNRDVQFLVLMAQWLSANKVDNRGYLVPLDSDTLHGIWDQLRIEYPTEFALALDVPGWHRQEAQVAEESRDWHAMAFHLSRLIEAMDAINADAREHRHWHTHRGRAFAELGNWRKASEDYMTAIQWNSDDLAVISGHALLRLAAADAKGYSESCKRLLDQFGESANGEVAARIAWTCLLAPSLKENETTLDSLIDRAKVDGRVPASCQIVRGVRCARAGQWEEALKILDEAQILGEGIDCARAWLFLAYVNHHLGKHEEAQRWIKQARIWMERWCDAKPKTAIAKPPLLPWNHRLELKILSDEIEKVLVEPKDGKKIGNIE